MSPELLIVGHLAANEDHTASGTKVSNGGSAYYCAVGASLVDPALVGVVAPVGLDFDPAQLDRLGLDRRGVLVLAGATPRFVIHQHQDGSRRFTADRGGGPRPEALAAAGGPPHRTSRPPGDRPVPPAARLARHRTPSPGPAVGVGRPVRALRMTLPQQSRQVRDAADLVFLNEEEHRLLGLPADSEAVLKLGACGARYLTRGAVHRVASAPVDVVDTTGAGDLLAGVFLASRLKGVGPVEALARAVRAATASVTAFGVDGPHPPLARDVARPDPASPDQELQQLCVAR